MKYRSTKTYDHARGLTCAFRQWKAESHCHLLHGYSLGITFTFEADELDHCGWVVDFGGLKSLFGMLEDTFDHTLLVADDDPGIQWFKALAVAGMAKVVFVEGTGCEAFAALIFETTKQWLVDAGFSPRAQLYSVEVKEHGANSAIALRDPKN